MLFSFFLKKILGKVLTIPLAASFVYPTLGGNIVVRSIHLQPPAESAAAHTDLSVRKVRVEPVWSTMFDEIVQVEQLSLYGVSAEIDVSDPLLLIYCLHNAKCAAPHIWNVQRAKLAAASQVQDEQANQKEEQAELTPLRMQVARFSISESEVHLYNGERRLTLELVQGEGRNAVLPFGEQSLSLRADILVREGEGPVAPVRALLQWHTEGQLEAALTLKDMPLRYLEALFPQLKDQALQLTAASDEAVVDGMLSGTLTLVYDANATGGRKWRLR